MDAYRERKEAGATGVPWEEWGPHGTWFFTACVTVVEEEQKKFFCINLCDYYIGDDHLWLDVDHIQYINDLPNTSMIISC
jgi:hypothetical protein